MAITLLIMMNKSLYLSIKYIISLMRFSKSIPSHIEISDSSYIGLDGNELPLKIIKSNKNTLFGESLDLNKRRVA